MNKKFVIINQEVSYNAEEYLWKIPLDGTWEVIFREVDKDKTLKQLGALFGLWVKHLSGELARSEDYIHRMLKAKFLARIYIIEPLTPSQEQWVELIAIYQQAGDQKKLEKHAKRISLSWAKLKQMKEYMRAIEEHYQSDDGDEEKSISLPVIDKYWKHQ